MNLPVVSVLMPVHNAEAFVGEAVESMLVQTYTNFELLVLDDGSTDGTARVVSLYSDQRIRYYRNSSSIGIANTLNIGLKLAKGKYIARFDGDDISLPERLRIQVEYLDKHPETGLCSTAMQLIGNETGCWIRDMHPEEVKITLLFHSPILHASSMFRKQLFLANGLIYRPDAVPAEDYELWSRAVRICKMVNLPEVLYLYRIHSAQVPKNDERALACVRNIKQEYLLAVLPGLSTAVVTSFYELFVDKMPHTKEEVRVMEKLLNTIIDTNKSVRFFDSKRLKRRLRRVFAAKVFYLVASEKNYDCYLLSKLRIKQVLKLLLPTYHVYSV